MTPVSSDLMCTVGRGKAQRQRRSGRHGLCELIVCYVGRTSEPIVPMLFDVCSRSKG